MDDEDIRHAYRNAIIAHIPDDEGLIVLVGPIESGPMAEIGYLISSGNVHVIVHAMTPARPKYLR
ncbi:MAG: hypothetical protein WCP28_12990 [Actinomycetes bacterium]